MVKQRGYSKIIHIMCLKSLYMKWSWEKWDENPMKKRVGELWRGEVWEKKRWKGHNGGSLILHRNGTYKASHVGFINPPSYFCQVMTLISYLVAFCLVLTHPTPKLTILSFASSLGLSLCLWVLGITYFIWRQAPWCRRLRFQASKPH